MYVLTCSACSRPRCPMLSPAECWLCGIISSHLLLPTVAAASHPRLNPDEEMFDVNPDLNLLGDLGLPAAALGAGAAAGAGAGAGSHATRSASGLQQQQQGDSFADMELEDALLHDEAAAALAAAPEASRDSRPPSSRAATSDTAAASDQTDKAARLARGERPAGAWAWWLWLRGSALLATLGAVILATLLTVHGGLCRCCLLRCCCCCCQQLPLHLRSSRRSTRRRPRQRRSASRPCAARASAPTRRSLTAWTTWSSRACTGLSPACLQACVHVRVRACVCVRRCC